MLTMMVGLAMIESVAIYALVIALVVHLRQSAFEADPVKKVIGIIKNREGKR